MNAWVFCKAVFVCVVSCMSPVSGLGAVNSAGSNAIPQAMLRYTATASTHGTNPPLHHARISRRQSNRAHHYSVFGQETVTRPTGTAYRGGPRRVTSVRRTAPCPEAPPNIQTPPPSLASPEPEPSASKRLKTVFFFYPFTRSLCYNVIMVWASI